MSTEKRNLMVVSVIAVVNALGYGIIIPILYSYSSRFNLSDFQNGLLFAVFSVFQFLSTPVIGRLSDKYGRRPLLIISLIGTVVSFLMMAFARSAWWLFLARALDGATAGNIPVVQAVISDTTEIKNRAKGFGIIGASFGAGLVFGPVISALTVGYGGSIPFLISAVMSLLAVLLTAFVLEETNKQIGKIMHEKLFNLKKMFEAILDPSIGMTLTISFVYSLAFSLFIFAYQPVSVKALGLSAKQISTNFVLFGLVGLISQLFVIPLISKKFGDKKTLFGAVLGSCFTFFGLFASRSIGLFVFFSMSHALLNGFVSPMISSLLSKEVDSQSQGEMQGLNSSYVSLGMIIGPVVGGFVANYSIYGTFLAGMVFCAVCVFLAKRVLRTKAVLEHL